MSFFLHVVHLQTQYPKMQQLQTFQVPTCLFFDPSHECSLHGGQTSEFVEFAQCFFQTSIDSVSIDLWDCHWRETSLQSLHPLPGFRRWWTLLVTKTNSKCSTWKMGPFLKDSFSTAIWSYCTWHSVCVQLAQCPATVYNMPHFCRKDFITIILIIRIIVIINLARDRLINATSDWENSCRKCITSWRQKVRQKSMNSKGSSECTYLRIEYWHKSINHVIKLYINKRKSKHSTTKNDHLHHIYFTLYMWYVFQIYV